MTRFTISATPKIIIFPNFVLEFLFLNLKHLIFIIMLSEKVHSRALCKHEATKGDYRHTREVLDLRINHLFHHLTKSLTLEPLASF